MEISHKSLMYHLNVMTDCNNKSALRIAKTSLVSTARRADFIYNPGIYPDFLYNVSGSFNKSPS